jgi:anti-sigma B factor antagonist
MAEENRTAMTIRTSTTAEGRIGLLELRGSLVGDGDTEELRSSVADFVEQGIRNLVIDARKLNYINSAGVGAIISAHATFRNKGGDIVLAGLTGGVQNVLAITRLIDVFEVRDTVDEAISVFHVNHR